MYVLSDGAVVESATLLDIKDMLLPSFSSLSLWRNRSLCEGAEKCVINECPIPYSFYSRAE